MKLLKEEEGFTLLETVVAFAILSAAFAVFYPIFSSSYTHIDTAKKRG